MLLRLRLKLDIAFLLEIEIIIFSQIKYISYKRKSVILYCFVYSKHIVQQFKTKRKNSFSSHKTYELNNNKQK